MSILKHLNGKKMHHAYLIEGAKEEIVPEIKIFCESLNVKTVGNPDFVHISIDNFKIDEAFVLRAMSSNKSFSSSKKVFLVCVNTISLDAQNVLLKIFEEPTKDTIFFLLVPDLNMLLKTLISRFYIIKKTQEENGEEKKAEKFITMSLKDRMEYLKELLTETEEGNEEEEEGVVVDSARTKAMNFLNALEIVLHKKLTLKEIATVDCFNHFLKVREFLRMPGSSTKNLMESIAIVVPVQ